METRVMPQSLAKLWVHLIFSTKDRYPFLSDKSITASMHAYLATVLHSHQCETLIVGGVADHVQIVRALQNLFNRARGPGDQENLICVDQREINSTKEISLAEWIWCVLSKSVPVGSGYALHCTARGTPSTNIVSG
jgi:Transposase IS200 like